MSELKIFRLQTKINNRLRIHKIDIPQSMARSGARIVLFSPDGRWLVVIDTYNVVRIYRIMQNEGRGKTPQLRSKPIELRRLSREPAKTNHQHGSHGNYNRSISRVAFSADSRILVIGDLCGYLDTWVLEGYEDLTQLDDADVNEIDSLASSDDEKDDKEQRPSIVLGQHWIRNPNASLIPRLAATPVILSFRPSSKPVAPRLTNGTPAVHPTRQTPHPHSHNLPDGEDRLFALTSEHQVYEFEILSGRLSSWSRRNPTSHLPAGFRTIRDRAMGLIWDMNEGRERVWIYGSSWLWMFDLLKDLPRPEESAKESQKDRIKDEVAASTIGSEKRKRKREAVKALRAAREPGKQDSGAGNKMPDGEQDVGIGQKIRRTDGPESNSSQWTSLAPEYSPGSEDDNDGRVGGPGFLELRRDIGESEKHSNGDTGDAPSSHASAKAGHDTELVNAQRKSGIPYWGTHKYRPILGIVPLERGYEGADEDAGLDRYDDERATGVEVALVERPPWDMDLPPRYHGDQEWDNR